MEDQKKDLVPKPMPVMNITPMQKADKFLEQYVSAVENASPEMLKRLSEAHRKLMLSTVNK